jgi:hypothetical protein
MQPVIKESGSEESSEWVLHGKMLRMPAPETANWLELYGSWDGFVEAVHKSIGGPRGSGVVRFAKREDGGGDHDLQSRRAGLNVTL